MVSKNEFQFTKNQILKATISVVNEEQFKRYEKPNMNDEDRRLKMILLSMLSAKLIVLSLILRK